MIDAPKRPLKVFLCHAHEDKPFVREVYQRLVADGVDTWLDEEKLLPGQDWDAVIKKALQEADAIVICLSRTSVSREGYVHVEIKEALENAKKKPFGTIFVIPAKLDDCDVPSYLRNWHWVELFSENGHERLMRALRSRAEAVGAMIDPASIAEFMDEELEAELRRLFFEGRGAALVENWDKAINRFSKLLSMNPGYLGVSEQLANAKREKSLAELYTRGIEAYQNGSWETAIELLNEVLEKSPDYKEAAGLLKSAKEQKQLSDFYAEAQQLYAAKEWKAVITIFDKINLIDPNYVDIEQLLPLAHKELDELERIKQINARYSQAISQIDAGNWSQARILLEKVQSEEPNFADSEGLLKKVHDEIYKIEERRKRINQVNILYEQAHGLFRSKSWRLALEKLEEIHKLDTQFQDKEGIGEKAKAALEREEEEIQVQNKLAAIYTEAVSLLRDEKYEQALAKLQEIKAIDATYPDRQKVQDIARKKLKDRHEDGTASNKSFVTLGILLVFIGLIAFLGWSQRFKFFPPRIQIRITTTSDWTAVEWKSGGMLRNIKKLSSSLQASDAGVDGTIFYLYQPLERADGFNSVEMVLEATLTNITSDTQIVLEGKRGCIGGTTVELFNATAEPVLVETLTWGDSCSSDGLNFRRFEIPVDFFIE